MPPTIDPNLVDLRNGDRDATPDNLHQGYYQCSYESNGEIRVVSEWIRSEETNIINTAGLQIKKNAVVHFPKGVVKTLHWSEDQDDYILHSRIVVMEVNAEGDPSPCPGNICRWSIDELRFTNDITQHFFLTGPMNLSIIFRFRDSDVGKRFFFFLESRARPENAGEIPATLRSRVFEVVS